MTTMAQLKYGGGSDPYATSKYSGLQATANQERVSAMRYMQTSGANLNSPLISQGAVTGRIDKIKDQKGGVKTGEEFKQQFKKKTVSFTLPNVCKTAEDKLLLENHIKLI